MKPVAPVVFLPGSHSIPGVALKALTSNSLPFTLDIRASPDDDSSAGMSIACIALYTGSAEQS